jgi:hypothetical protein
MDWVRAGWLAGWQVAQQHRPATHPPLPPTHPPVPPAPPRRANGHLGNVDFRVADVTELQMPDGCCDVIFSNWLLMYLSDAEVAALANNMLRWVRGARCWGWWWGLGLVVGAGAGGGRWCGCWACGLWWRDGGAAAAGRGPWAGGGECWTLVLAQGARPLCTVPRLTLAPSLHPAPAQLAPGGVVFFRESCFRQSGDKARKANPTHYRNPREYFRCGCGCG